MSDPQIPEDDDVALVVPDNLAGDATLGQVVDVLNDALRVERGLVRRQERAELRRLRLRDELRQIVRNLAVWRQQVERRSRS